MRDRAKKASFHPPKQYTYELVLSQLKREYCAKLILLISLVIFALGKITQSNIGHWEGLN